MRVVHPMHSQVHRVNHLMSLKSRCRKTAAQEHEADCRRFTMSDLTSQNLGLAAAYAVPTTCLL